MLPSCLGRGWAAIDDVNGLCDEGAYRRRQARLMTYDLRRASNYLCAAFPQTSSKLSWTPNILGKRSQGPDPEVDAEHATPIRRQMLWVVAFLLNLSERLNDSMTPIFLAWRGTSASRLLDPPTAVIYSPGILNVRLPENRPG